jgi:hypothetical protein
LFIIIEMGMTAPSILLYVAPNGDNANPGTLEQPFATLSKALSAATPGATIYLRGGSYRQTTTFTLSKKGFGGDFYKIWAYPGETPVLDFTGQPTGTHGITLSGDYWHIKGLEIKNAGKSGIRITGNYNIIENCSIHHCGDAGLYIGINKGTNLNQNGESAAYNQVINCDSYLNCDLTGSTGPGGNADGFACKLNAGKGNVFRGCRAWENSDDGWDLYMTNFQVIIENCWTWHNGDPKSFGYTGDSWGGNGNGFKVGGGSPTKDGEFASHGAHILRNCIAFDIRYGKGDDHKAFDRNNNMAGVTMINCVTWRSITGFWFAKSPDDGSRHILKNCVAFFCNLDQLLAPDTTQAYNSWNRPPGIKADSDDFVSLDAELAKAPRQPDGSLPENGFARLAPGSDLIDRGIDVGLPFKGAAPDLGAFERQ